MIFLTMLSKILNLKKNLSSSIFKFFFQNKIRVQTVSKIINILLEIVVECFYVFHSDFLRNIVTPFWFIGRQEW